MLRKLFASTSFFIFVFIIFSIIADINSCRRLIHTDPGEEHWTYKCDFRVFWIAGYKANNYISPRPIEAAYGKKLHKYIAGDKSRLYDKSEPFYHFRYSPLAAFFMIPLALIPYPAASLIIWLIINNIALLAALLLLARQISLDFNISRGLRYLILWSAFLVSAKFYLMNLSVGQIDAVIALFFVLFLMAYIRNLYIVCGIIFALIIQFKMLFLPVLLYFLLAGKWKLVLSALLGGAAFFLAPSMIIGFGRTIELLKDWAGILTLSVPSQLLNFKNQSIVYFIARPFDRLFYLLSSLLTTSAYILLLAFRKLSKAEEDKKFKYLEVSLLIIIMLLFSPLVWTAHFTSLIIPLGVMVLFLSSSRNRKPLYIALAAFLILSVATGTDLTKFIPVINKGRYANIALGALFLVYALIHSYRQQPRNAA